MATTAPAQEQALHVIVLDDDMFHREIIREVYGGTFPGAFFQGCEDSAAVHDYIATQIHSGDHCILISDFNIPDIADPAINCANYAQAIRDRGAIAAGVYFVSGSIEDACEAARDLAAADPEIPTFGADKSLGAGENSFIRLYQKSQSGRHLTGNAPAQTAAETLALTEERKRIRHALTGCEGPLEASKNILHGVIPEPGHESLMLSFRESRGIPATTAIAYTHDDLEAHAAQGQKSILAVETFTKDMIPWITNSYVAGVVCAHADLPGHISPMLAGYGIPSLVSADDHGLFERLRLEYPAGHQVTLDPAGKKLHTAPCTIGDASGLFSDPDIADRFLKGCVREFPRKQAEYAKSGIHVPSFEISVTRWDNLDFARDRKAAVGLIRSEFFVLDKPDPTITSLLLSPDGYGDNAPFAEKNFAFMKELATYADVPMKLRLLDIKPEECLSPKDQRTWNARPDHEKHLVMARVTQALHRAQLSAFADVFWDIEDASRPVLTIPFDARLDAFYSVSDDFRTASYIAGDVSRAEREYQPCAMIESLEACNNIEAIAKRACALSIGGNDLTTAVLGVSRYDDNARLKITSSSGVGRDPFRTLYPEVAAVIIDIPQRARAANPDIRISFCGDQAPDIASLCRIRDARIDTVTVPPTKECLHVLPWEMLVRTGTDNLSRVEAALSACAPATVYRPQILVPA